MAAEEGQAKVQLACPSCLAGWPLIHWRSAAPCLVAFPLPCAFAHAQTAPHHPPTHPPAPAAAPADCNSDLQGCSLAELDALSDWRAQLCGKYPVVGQLVEQQQQPAAAEAAAQ